nr:RagB/SusD family nutrient uptake outer membrane protein [Algibacter sp. L3A6]
MLSSCSDFLEEVPPTFISTPNYYQTAGDARTAVDGIYERMRVVYSRWWMGIDMYTDDLVSRTAGSSNFNMMALHTTFPSAGLFESTDVYSAWWEGIGRANNVIANVPAIDMDEAEKNLIIGEARALRAFYYYNLVRAFGDVPMVNTAVLTEADFMKPRAAVDDIYNEIIIPDLLFAGEHCSDGLHDGHITKWTAKLILSEVYLTRAGMRRTSQGVFVQGDASNYALASEMAKDVVDNAPNSLNIVASLSAVAYGTAWDKATPFTSESMLEISYLPVSGYGNWMSRESRGWTRGTNYWGSDSSTPLIDEGITGDLYDLSFPSTPNVGTYLPTPHLYDEFEDGDERRDFNIMTRYDDGEGNTYLCQPMFRKFMDLDYLTGVDGTSFQYTNNNTILYRFADALLIYAEAQNEADGAPNAEAYEAVNKIRNRAGLADLVVGLSQEDFRNALWKERRCEFAGEYKRKFDLIRTNRLTNSTLSVNLDWTPDQDAVTTFRNTYSLYTGSVLWPDHEWLWPIPQSQLDLNIENNWEQNEGY